MKKYIVGFIIAAATASPMLSFADTATVHFKVYSPTDTLFNSDVTVSPCPEAEGSATTTLNAYCIFGAAPLTVDASWNATYGSYYINSIATIAPIAPDWWHFFINGKMSDFGVNSTLLHDGDTILWSTARQPMTISVSTSSPMTGATTTVTVKGFNDAAWSFIAIPNATVHYGSEATTTDTNGHADIFLTSTSTIKVSAEKNGFIPSDSIDVTPHDAPAPALAATSTATSTPDTTASSTPPTTPTTSSGGGGGGGSFMHRTVDVNRAIGFMAAQQKADGSFGNSMYTDWAAIACASTPVCTMRDSLKAAVIASAPTLSATTDAERHAIALEAMGVNPQSGAGMDYIAAIITHFDGTQFGDKTLVGDDIFAIFPLIHAGYTTSDTEIQKTVAFIISQQKADGSWGGVDMTAAAVQALSLTPSLPGVSDALGKAKAYLHSAQSQTGGFGNSFSTAWALQAIVALGESPSTWAPNVYNANDALADAQQSDGGMDTMNSDAQTRLWATSYTVPAAVGKTWDGILGVFAKANAGTTPASGHPSTGGELNAATSTGAGSPPVKGDLGGFASSTNATSTAATSTTSTSTNATTTPTTPHDVIASEAKQSRVSAETPRLPRPSASLQSSQRRNAHNKPATSSPAQTAAVGSVIKNGFFARLWHAILGIF